MGLCRSRIFVFGLLLVLALVAFVFSGPLFPIQPILPQFSVPADVESYVDAGEARIPTIKPDQEKKIFWKDPVAKSRTDLVFVYLHGFSASRGEISPVMEELAQEFGANLFMTRLKAHGLTDSAEAFGTVQAQDWINDAHEAMEIARKLGDRIVVVGMSTGGMIALHLASHYSLHAVVLLSPNYRLADWRARFISGRFGPWLARELIGPYREFKTESKDHAEFWTPRYRSEGVVALMDLLNYVDHIRLGAIRAPVLTVYTRHDDLVDTDAIRERSGEIQSPGSRLVDLDVLPRHELAGRILYPEGIPLLKAQIRKFLNEVPQQISK